ncbi:hypothetical protein F4780DRAFT_100542 [Xylariomycetidae sp. FL0641]|nr:hypothetical protein F4780DRAFT_100542 [Xylariomycetidae sp. FL0641]
MCVCDYAYACGHVQRVELGCSGGNDCQWPRQTTTTATTNGSNPMKKKQTTVKAAGTKQRSEHFLACLAALDKYLAGDKSHDRDAASCRGKADGQGKDEQRSVFNVSLNEDCGACAAAADKSFSGGTAFAFTDDESVDTDDEFNIELEYPETRSLGQDNAAGYQFEDVENDDQPEVEYLLQRDREFWDPERRVPGSSLYAYYDEGSLARIPLNVALRPF